MDLSERVFKVVRDFRARGASVIFISHRMAEIALLCDRATVPRDGVTVGVTPTKGGEETIVKLMLGSDVARATAAPVARAPRPTTGRETPALEVNGLSCGRALHDVSFGVNRGEALGIAALEGQGQEELFDCIAGVRRADAGEVRAEGRALKLRHPADAIRAGLVLVPANRLVSLLPQCSVQENVALAAFYAVGDNREACHLSGIRVWRVLFANYLLCAILAAIAGLVVVGGTNAADLSLADSYLLPSVACVVIGGTSIFGGRGGYGGTIVGALILTVLTGLLTLLDVSEPIKQILYGAIILSLAAAYARLTE